jgi:hypothetical protein
MRTEDAVSGQLHQDGLCHQSIPLCKIENWSLLEPCIYDTKCHYSATQVHTLFTQTLQVPMGVVLLILFKVSSRISAFFTRLMKSLTIGDQVRLQSWIFSLHASDFITLTQSEAAFLFCPGFLSGGEGLESGVTNDFKGIHLAT